MKKNNTFSIIFNFIFLLFVFFVPELHANSVEYKRYDKQQMGVFYKEAQQYKEEFKWDDVVNRGREIIKTEWEKRMWEEITRQLNTDNITEDEADQIMNASRAQWEAEALTDGLIEKGRWKAGKIKDQTKDDLQDQATIDTIRIWAQTAEAEAQGMDFETGLARWQALMSQVTDKKNEKRTTTQEFIQNKIQQEISAGRVIPGGYEEDGFKEELLRIASEYEKRWEWEVDAEWVRKHNIWLKEWTKDESLRQEYESKRAEVVVKKIIEETETKADQLVEESLTEEVEQGEWDSPANYEAYEKAIGEGLQQWNRAIDSFYRNWMIWKTDAEDQFKQGQLQWKLGYEEINKSRDAWLLRTEERIKEGMDEWAAKWEDVQRQREQAEAELTTYIQIQQENWEDHIKGIEDVTLNGSDILKQAYENINWTARQVNAYRGEYNELVDKYNKYNKAYRNWRDVRNNYTTHRVQSYHIVYKPNGREYDLLDTGPFGGGDADEVRNLSFHHKTSDTTYWIHEGERYKVYNSKAYRISEVNAKYTYYRNKRDEYQEKIENSGYLFYQTENEKWIEIRDEIQTLAEQSEEVFDEDIWGNTLGLFDDNRSSNPEDLYYLNEAEKEYAKLQQDKAYWENRLEIAQAVLDYAQAEGSLKEKKQDSEANLAERLTDMNNATAEYQALMDELNNVVKATMENKQQIVSEKASQIETAKTKLDEAVKEYEQARIGLLSLQNPDLQALIREDMNTYYQNLLDVDSQIELKLQEYNNSINAYLKSETELAIGMELEAKIKDVETYKTGYNLIFSMIDNNKTKDNWEEIVANELINEAEQIWQDEDTRNNKIVNINEKMDNIASSATFKQEFSARLDLLNWIEAEKDYFETEYTHAKDTYEFLAGYTTKEQVTEANQHADLDYQMKLILENFESADLINKTADTIDVKEISTYAEYMTAIIDQVKDTIKTDYQAINTMLKFLDDHQAEISSLLIVPETREEKYEGFKNSLRTSYDIALKLKDIYENNDLTDLDNKEELLMNLLKTGDPINQASANIIINEKGLTYQDYFYSTSAWEKAVEHKQALIEYTIQADKIFDQDKKALSELYANLGIEKTDRFWGSDSEEVIEKAETILDQIENLQKQGINTELLVQIQNNLNSVLFNYKTAEYIAINQDKTLAEIETERDQFTTDIENRTDQLEYIDKIMVELNLEEINAQALLDLLNDTDFINSTTSQINDIREELIELHSNNKIHEAVSVYVNKGLFMQEPSVYLASLTTLTSEEKEKAQDRIKAWYLTSEFKNNHDDIIKSQSIQEWINNKTASQDIEDYKDELFADICFKEYQSIISEYQGTGYINDINKYARDIRQYAGILMLRDYLVVNNITNITGNETQIAKDFLQSRTDLSTNTATIAEYAGYLSDNSYLDPKDYLSESIQIITWKQQYYDEYGSTDNFLKKEEDIEAYLDNLESYGLKPGQRTALEEYIIKISQIKSYQNWARFDWYTDHMNMTEAAINELKIYLSGKTEIIEPIYQEKLYTHLNSVLIEQQINEKGINLKEELSEEINRLNEELQILSESLEIRKQAINDRSMEHGRSWREYLNTDYISDMIEQVILTSEIKNDEAVDDRIDTFYTGSGYYIETARDRLNDLITCIHEGVNLLSQYENIDTHVSEVKEEIKNNYYNINDGYKTNLSEYINNLQSTYAGEQINKNNAINNYNAELSQKQGYKEEILRNGGVIENIEQGSKNYRNNVLNPVSQKVALAEEEYDNARQEYADAEEEFKTVQLDYISQLQQIKEQGETMDEAQLEYQKALNIYQWAVSEYMYESSDRANENGNSTVTTKRDALDEYNRINNIYTDVEQRCTEKQAEVEAVKKHDELMDDPDIEVLMNEYQHIMEQYIRVGRAEVETEKIIANKMDSMNTTRKKLEKAKNNYYRITGSVNNKKIAKRDDIINKMLSRDICHKNKQYWGNHNAVEWWAEDIGLYMAGGRIRPYNYNNIVNQGKGYVHQYDGDVYIYTGEEYTLSGEELHAYNHIYDLKRCTDASKAHFEDMLKYPFLRYARYSSSGWGWGSTQYYKYKGNKYPVLSMQRYWWLWNNDTYARSRMHKNEADISSYKRSLKNKINSSIPYICNTDVDGIKNLLDSRFSYLETSDIERLLENGTAENKFDITSLKKEINIQKIDYSIDDPDDTTDTYSGYNTADVLKGLRKWLDQKAEQVLNELMTTAQTKNYQSAEVEKLKETIMRKLQEYAVAHGRAGAGYKAVTGKLLDLGRDAYTKAVAQEQELQQYKWNLKQQGFLDEQQKWTDSMQLIKERGNQQWTLMQNRYVSMWRGWYNDTKKAIAEKEEDYILAESLMKQDRDNWINDIVQNGVEYRKDELQQMIENSVNSAQEKANEKGISINIVNGKGIAQDIINEMRPEELSDALINSARGMDISFSIDKIRTIEYNNSTSKKFQSRLEHYNKAMEDMSKLKLLETLKEQLRETEESLEKSLADQEMMTSDSLTGMFRDKKFDINSMDYSRRIVIDSSLIGGDEHKTQKIRAYNTWGKYDIEYNFLTYEQALTCSSYELELHTKVAMDSIMKAFEKKQDAFSKHTGKAPSYNGDGDITRSGKGETGRLVQSLQKAEKEKAEGKAKADQPWYKKGILPGVNISLSSIAKVGLSFIPGGQLVTLGMSVAETAVGLIDGSIQGASGLLNVATSAIGAGANWLGDVVGTAAKGIVGGAKWLGKAVYNVGKSIVTGVGDVINSGFKVNSKGNLDWHMDKKKWDKGFTGLGRNLAKNTAYDLAQGISIETGFDKGIIGDITKSRMARGFSEEMIKYANTGEFNMDIMSVGYLSDKLYSSIYGENRSDAWGEGVLGDFGRRMYSKDSDLASIKNYGLSVTFSKHEKTKLNNHMTGGFDIQDLTYTTITDPMKTAQNAYNMGKGIVNGMNNAIKKGYNFVKDSLFDQEEKKSNQNPNQPYSEEKMPIARTEQLKNDREALKQSYIKLGCTEEEAEELCQILEGKKKHEGNFVLIAYNGDARELLKNQQNKYKKMSYKELAQKAKLVMDKQEKNLTQEDKEILNTFHQENAKLSENYKEKYINDQFEADVNEYFDQQIEYNKKAMKKYEVKNWKKDKNYYDKKVNIEKLTQKKEEFNTATNEYQQYGDEYYTLSNVIYNEAGVFSDTAKEAIAYAYLNRTGGEVREPNNSAEISHYSKHNQNFNDYSQKTKLIFLNSYITSMNAAATRMSDTDPVKNDPTKGATHWVSPNGLENKKRQGYYYRKEYDTYFPNWARANNDPIVKEYKKKGIYSKNYSEIQILGIESKYFLFYKGVRY